MMEKMELKLFGTESFRFDANAGFGQEIDNKSAPRIWENDVRKERVYLQVFP
jgi:hypothetical protein